MARAFWTWGLIGASLVLCPAAAFAVTLTIAYSAAEVGGGRVAVPVSIDCWAGEEASTVQFDIAFDDDLMSLIDVTPGMAAADAGKQVSLSSLAPGVVRVIVAGFNQTPIPNGVIAEADFNVNAGTPAGFHTVAFGLAAVSDPYGAPLPIELLHGGIDVPGPEPAAGEAMKAEGEPEDETADQAEDQTEDPGDGSDDESLGLPSNGAAAPEESGGDSRPAPTTGERAREHSPAPASSQKGGAWLEPEDARPGVPYPASRERAPARTRSAARTPVRKVDRPQFDTRQAIQRASRSFEAPVSSQWRERGSIQETPTKLAMALRGESSRNGVDKADTACLALAVPGQEPPESASSIFVRTLTGISAGVLVLALSIILGVRLRWRTVSSG